MLLPHEWHGQARASETPLVLVSGLGAKGTSWYPFLEDVARERRVLTVDLPGSGSAPALTAGASLRDLARALAATLEALDLVRFDVVGRSMGGQVAQELALADPSAIRKLVLSSTTGRVDEHLASVFRLWAEMAENGVPQAIRHRSSMLWCLGARALDDTDQAARYLAARRTGDRPKDYANQARACAEHDALDRLTQLDVPTLVLAGTDDRLMPKAHAEALARAIPNSRLRFIPDAGHLAYLEAPRTFHREVAAFLEDETECRNGTTTW